MQREQPADQYRGHSPGDQCPYQHHNGLPSDLEHRSHRQPEPEQYDGRAEQPLTGHRETGTETPFLGDGSPRQCTGRRAAEQREHRSTCDRQDGSEQSCHGGEPGRERETGKYAVQLGHAYDHGHRAPLPVAGKIGRPDKENLWPFPREPPIWPCSTSWFP